MRKHTYRVSVKELFKLFKCLASRGIHMIFRWLGLLFKLFTKREREQSRELP